MPYRAYIEGTVRRDAVLSTSLRIKQQFSIRISVPRLSPFAYAGGDSVCSGRDRAGTGDMRRRSVIYAPSSIIGVHISMQMSRYARPTLGIRLQRAHISFGFPGGSPMCDGPRTRYFRIFLNDKVLQKDNVRGPIIFRGITNKAIL